MNKLKKKFIPLLLLFVIATQLFTPAMAAHAQWGQTVCPGVNSCYGCNAFGCNIYKVENYSQTFTLEECKEVVRKSDAVTSFSTYASLVLGLKSNVFAGWLSLYGNSVSKNAEMFKTAVAKEAGLEIKAEYVINRNSYSLNTYRKGTYRYIYPSTTSPSYTRMLKLTSPLMYGEDVKKVQTRLNSLGYNAGTADGYFGSGTQRAVINFQSMNKLSADGIIGSSTWTKLFSSSAISNGSSSGGSSSSTGYTRLLKVTSPLMYGEDVKKVQNRLNALGYNAGTADGYYGNGTAAAVKKFQSAKGLSADGMVGSATWNKLF